MKKKKARLFNLKHFPLDFARIMCRIFCVPDLLRIKKLYTKKPFKIRGGALIVANHISFWDPFIICNAFWYRRVFSLAAEVVMKNKVVAFFLKGLGCIKIDRNIYDIEAIKKAINKVKEGHVLTVFPQGGIQGEADISTIKSGVILIAMQAKVPIIPCYIHKEPGKRKRTYITVGEPIDMFNNPLSIKDLNKCAQIVVDKMNLCKETFESTRRN